MQKHCPENGYKPYTFCLWQMFMPIFILKNKIKFDIAHNLNFHTDAFPTFLWILRKPLVWGPINHHEKIPSQYLLSKKELIKDRIKTAIKIFNWNVDPFIHISKRTADYILVGNSSVIKRLNLKNNTYNLSQVASDDNNIDTKKSEKFTIISAGRFVQLKGFDITLASYEKFFNKLCEADKSNIELLVIGNGPLKSYLKNQSKNYNSLNSIKFIEWLTKEEINNYYSKSHLYLFPSYEGAGMVIAEALSFALPIICFDNYGPGELTNDKCAIRIPYSSYDKSIEDFSKALIKIYEDKELLQNMSLEARKLFEEKYTWEAKGREINSLYLKLKEKYKIKDSK